MSKFKHIAEQIASRLYNTILLDGGIKASNVVDIVEDAAGGKGVNCYPGVPSEEYHDITVIVSLMLKTHKKGRGSGHLKCRQAIEKLVQHMQGYCISSNNSALLITDDWDEDAYEDWRANLKRIRSEVHLEVYLVSEDKVQEIPL